MESLSDITTGTATEWFAEEAGAVAIADSAHTQPAMVERAAPGGTMAPLLRRDEREAYRVVEGEVTFFVDGDEIPAGEGDVVVAPAGAARTFRVESEAARWVVVTRVASLERFLDFGLAVSEPLPFPEDGWPSASELQTVESLAADNGIELLGPPGALPG